MFARSTAFLVSLLLIASSAFANEADSPRTGYFRVHMTTTDLLGEDGAQSLAEMFEPDEKLAWQLYVPKNYEPSKPAGVIVFLTHRGSWGGSRKEYNPALEERNLIWAGLLGAGDREPMNERMMRLIMTPTMLAKTYALDPGRVYIGGFSGGAHVAAIAATGKPELFRGGLFVGGAVAWGDQLPAKIEQVRNNRYVFVAGSNDVALKTVRRTVLAYRDAGVENSTLIVMANQRQEMPTRSYFQDALEFLDGPATAGGD